MLLRDTDCVRTRFRGNVSICPFLFSLIFTGFYSFEKILTRYITCDTLKLITAYFDNSSLRETRYGVLQPNILVKGSFLSETYGN